MRMCSILSFACCSRRSASPPPVRQFTVLKCDKAEAKAWEEVWKSGEVDHAQDSLQNTQKDVSGVGCLAACVRLPMLVLILALSSLFLLFAGEHQGRLSIP
jgi:hypothetical protein